MNLVGIRALNAYENTRYQFFSTLLTNIVAILLSILAFFILDPEDVVIGLAVAFAISYWAGLFVTDFLLSKYLNSFALSRELGFYLKVSVIAGLSVALAAFIRAALGVDGNIPNLVIVLVITSLAYILFARVAKIKEVGETVKTVLRR
jgi:putative peptidoglycan lipid II flippase